jgi:hypothetical protein
MHRRQANASKISAFFFESSPLLLFPYLLAPFGAQVTDDRGPRHLVEMEGTFMTGIQKEAAAQVVEERSGKKKQRGE